MVRIGISGWRYKPWRGVFYPTGLAQRRELEFASREFDTIEINGTFYSLQRPEYFQQWSAETPEGFLFALKGSRFITHMRKLREIDSALANYFASGVLALGEKMGPVLWQFPPQVRWDGPQIRERFEAFFQLLPKSTRQAARLAKKCDDRMLNRSFLKIEADRLIRHCVEIRHESFAAPDFIDLLREHEIGLVAADTVEWPLLMDVTADFVYCRLHGSEQLYASGYEDVALNQWAEKVKVWAAGGTPEGRRAGSVWNKVRPRDVYVYFDNDAKVRAPFDAKELRMRVDRLMEVNKGSP